MVFGVVVIHLVKAVEDVFKFFGRDAVAGVGDFYFHPQASKVGSLQLAIGNGFICAYCILLTVFLRLPIANSYFYPPPFLSKLKRIRQKIVQYLFNLIPVNKQGNIFFR